ncbi:hypothetical protein BD626DRAFT_99642 [Schizophyllum amplum]|uniref:Uncharacterized protein n=1 Tax=Schizophyllum amplum TaxID=97359 RepID=A0A550CRE0_9AGAR|nr:hypothetical protein BD626DRAFT_99642 [Auriculariopsis ampla]
MSMETRIATRTPSYDHARHTLPHLPARLSPRIFHPRACLERPRSLTNILALHPHHSAPPSPTVAQCSPTLLAEKKFNMYTRVSDLLTLPLRRVFLVHSRRRLFISRTEYVDVADRSEGRGRAVNARARPPCSCKVQRRSSTDSLTHAPPRALQVRQAASRDAQSTARNASLLHRRHATGRAERSGSCAPPEVNKAYHMQRYDVLAACIRARRQGNLDRLGLRRRSGRSSDMKRCSGWRAPLEDSLVVFKAGGVRLRGGDTRLGR